MNNLLPVLELIRFISEISKKKEKDIIPDFISKINKYLPSITLTFTNSKPPKDKHYIPLTAETLALGYIRIDGNISEIPAESLVILRTLLNLISTIVENKALQHKLSENNILLLKQLKKTKTLINKVDFKYKDLADSINDILFSFDSDFKISYWNTAAEHFFNITKEQAIGKEMWTILPEFKNSELSNAIFASTISNKQETFKFNVIKNGNQKVFMVNVFPDEELSCSVFIKDITEEEINQNQENKFINQLKDSQKLESLGLLAGGIAHDFNNLLMGILGNVSLAMLDTNQNDPIYENLKEIEKSAKHSAKLAQKLLQYAGKGVLQIKGIDVSEFVQEITSLVKKSLPKTITIKSKFPDYPVYMECDVTQITQILMNFIINASDAMDGNGTIYIKIGTEYLDKIQYDTNNQQTIEKGEYVFIEVEDSGIGIKSENIDKIFDPFFTTKFTGRGLGLSAALGIAKQHRGTINVHSEEGKGSRFKLMLPTTQFINERETGKITSLWNYDKTVLFVDSQKDVRKVAERLLQRMGFEIFSTDSLKQAIEISQQHTIDIVILDQNLLNIAPDIFIKEIKTHNPQIKAVLSSDYNLQESMYKYQKAGFYMFIEKPYDFKELNHYMRMLILTPEETLQEF